MPLLKPAEHLAENAIGWNFLTFSLPIPFVITKYPFPQSTQSRIDGFTIIRFGKLFYKLLQVGILSNHKGGDRNVCFTALRGQVEAFVDDYGV
jgi:hypothetical protein